MANIKELEKHTGIEVNSWEVPGSLTVKVTLSSDLSRGLDPRFRSFGTLLIAQVLDEVKRHANASVDAGPREQKLYQETIAALCSLVPGGEVFYADKYTR